MREPGIFLRAQWRDLVMLNYAVDPKLLADRVPAGTELDVFAGRTFVSLVAFRFMDTRVLGARIPFHENFEEVNLRLYVRRRAQGQWRRGVVFIRELVPRLAIALIANAVFNENYLALQMAHEVRAEPGGVSAAYSWRNRQASGNLCVRASGTPSPAIDGSLEQFITEHYWGYAPRRSGGTLEYEVRHDPWRVWNVRDAEFSGNLAPLYGADFARVLQARPDSAFLAEGSPVAVYSARRIE